MIKAVIFDMDGLLIDSEPYWQAAEIEIFHPLHVPLTLDMCVQTMGLRIYDTVEYWYKRFPWKEKPLKEVADSIIQRVIDHLEEKGELMVGAGELISFFHQKGIRMVIASSSPYPIIQAVVKNFKLDNYIEFFYSADEEPLGKPHPGIYLTCVNKLGLTVDECIAFEDSINGLISAKAARMKVIGVPTATNFNLCKYDIADLKIHTLLDFGETEWEILHL